MIFQVVSLPYRNGNLHSNAKTKQTKHLHYNSKHDRQLFDTLVTQQTTSIRSRLRLVRELAIALPWPASLS